MKNNKTIGYFKKYLIDNFGTELSKSDVNEIFAFLLNVSYEEVLTMTNTELDEQVIKNLKVLIKKIEQKIPLAYLLHHKFFFNHDFLVDDNVLIPREDSELLVVEAMKFLDKFYFDQGIKVVDLCTGTGILGLTVANLRKSKDNYVLTDIDDQAIKNAEKNLAYLQLDQKKIKVMKANFLEVFKIIPKANLIICNPPYIDKNDSNITQSVRDHEPHLALFAKNKGLEFYELMAANFQEIVDLEKPFLIIMEMGFEQKDQIKKIFSKYLTNIKIEFLKDDNSNWRAFKLYNY